MDGRQAPKSLQKKPAAIKLACFFFVVVSFLDLDVLVRSLPASNMEDYIPSGRLLQKVSEVDIVYA